MHLHFHTLRHIAAYLHEQIRGCTAVEIFTQSRDELVIGLASDRHSMWLRISTSVKFAYVWPVDQFSKARKNVADLFPEIIGQDVVKAEVVPWERVIIIVFRGGYELVLKMHGNQSNVLLRKDGAVTEMFRNSLEGDLAFREAPGIFNETALDAPPTDLKDYVRAISPVFEKLWSDALARRMSGGTPAPDAMRALLREADSGTFWIARYGDKVRLLLFDPGDAEKIRVQGIAAALSVFIRFRFQHDSYAERYTPAKQLLEKQLSRLDGHIASYRESLRTIEEARSAEEIGSLLMASLHLLRPGLQEVTLDDFYRDNQPFRIKLDPKLNPHQNAERYFQKQKDRRKQKQTNETLLASMLEEREKLTPAATAFAALPAPSSVPLSEKGFSWDAMRALAAFYSEFAAPLGLDPESQENKKPVFFEFTKEGYTVLVGRNSKNNDELTFGTAHKDDMWLHARDAAGSHVVIRRKGKEFPRSVILFAASLAAAHSKRKNEAVVPVVCTYRKHVRKPKGAAAGKVIFEREETLLVEPVRISDLN